MQAINRSYLSARVHYQSRPLREKTLHLGHLRALRMDGNRKILQSIQPTRRGWDILDSMISNANLGFGTQIDLEEVRIKVLENGLPPLFEELGKMLMALEETPSMNTEPIIAHMIHTQPERMARELKEYLDLDITQLTARKPNWS